MPEGIATNDIQRLHQEEREQFCVMVASVRHPMHPHGTDVVKRHEPRAVGRTTYFWAIWPSSTILCSQNPLVYHDFVRFSNNYFGVTPFCEKCISYHLLDSKLIFQPAIFFAVLKFSGQLFVRVSPSISCGQQNVPLHEERFSLFSM